MPTIRWGLALLLHSSAVYTMAWGYFIGLADSGFDQWVRRQAGGHSQFLTIQGLALAGTTMILALLADLSPAFSSIKSLKRVLSIIALPLEFTISIIYWSLILLAPDLIVSTGYSGGEPTAAAPTAPFHLDLFVDLALHAVPAFTLLLDFFFFERKFSKVEMTRRAPALAVTVAVWYGCWVEYCATRNHGVFPYPFLTSSPLLGRIAIYISATLLALACLWAVNPLHPSVIDD